VVARQGHAIVASHAIESDMEEGYLTDLTYREQLRRKNGQAK
jgi:hypothetical protein